MGSLVEKEMMLILVPGKTNMTSSKLTEGFVLIEALISLLVVSVAIIEILIFVLNAGTDTLKMNVRIIETIENRNRSVVELFEDNK